MVEDHCGVGIGLDQRAFVDLAKMRNCMIKPPVLLGQAEVFNLMAIGTNAIQSSEPTNMLAVIMIPHLMAFHRMLVASPAANLTAVTNTPIGIPTKCVPLAI